MEDIDISKNIVSFGINKALFSSESLESGFLTRICRNNFSKEQLLQFQYELRHITNEMANQMVQALGISNVISNEYSWRTPPYADLPGVEIDLLIDRADKAFNLCEMKYTTGKFTIDKKYSEVLRNKVQRLYDVTKTRNSVFLTIISANGLTANAYANDIAYTLTSDDLFD